MSPRTVVNENCHLYSSCIGKGTVARRQKTPAFGAGISPIYVPSGVKGQGFSDTYRKACERVAADPRTPKYAAVDILMWLVLTDPNILPLKPGTLMLKIIGGDDNIQNWWKCWTIMGMSAAMHEQPKDALEFLQRAAFLVKRGDGSVPKWLKSRVDLVATDAAKVSPTR